MGTFGEYLGEVIICDEKRQEFIDGMIKLLQHGGMMQFQKVSLYGNEISLINPVELDETGKAHFFYNYFEDDSWESACFNANNLNLFSGKIGENEFNDVMSACHFLYELYSEDYGCAVIDGDILHSSCYISWINFILDKDFSMGNRFNLWKYYESYYINMIRRNGYDEDADPYLILDIVPRGLELAMGGRDLADIFYCVKGTESLEHDKIKKNSYPEEILRVRNELKNVFETYGESVKEELWEILLLSRDVRQTVTVSNEKLIAIVQATLRLPARVFVYLSAEILGFDFWTEWEKIYDKVYEDEESREYVEDRIELFRSKKRNESVGRMKTEEFLRNDGYFTFWSTPDEIKNKPNYYISDDDLMYWWDGSEKVVLSEKMVSKLQEWSRTLDSIEQELTDIEIVDFDMLKMLLQVLSKANNDYKRIFAFQNMFYEFVQNSKSRKHIAAIKLLERVLEENWEEGKIIEKCTGAWWLCSKNVTFNEGRVNVKRYLSVMANHSLRKVYFGF